MKGEQGDVNAFTGSSSEQVNLKVVHVSEKTVSSLKMLKSRGQTSGFYNCEQSWVVADAVLFRINFTFFFQ